MNMMEFEIGMFLLSCMLEETERGERERERDGNFFCVPEDLLWAYLLYKC